MTDAPSLANDILPLCAILSHFDPELLRELGGGNDEQIALLLDSDLVMNTYPLRSGYQLLPETREMILAELRERRPEAELALHTRAFHWFAAPVEPSPIGEPVARDENACFHHLHALVALLTPREAWQTLAGLIATARQSNPREPHHPFRLDYYEGNMALRTGDQAGAEAFFTSLVARPDLEPYTRVRALNGLANLSFNRTHYDRALELYQQVHEVARDAGDLFHQGAALINMGMIYNDLASYEQALDLTRQSLELFRQCSDSSREMYALYEIGNCAMQLGRWEVARTHYDQAATMAESLGLTARLASILWGQGLLHHLLGDEAASEAAYRRALDASHSPEHDDIMLSIDIWWYLGFLLHSQGRSDEAHEAYEQAFTLAGKLQRAHWQSLIQSLRGNLWREQGEPEQARAAYEWAIENIERLHSVTEDESIKIGLLGTTQQLYESMVHLCIEEGRPRDAFHYVERARSRAFLDTLVQKEPDLYDRLDQPVVTLEEVQALLPEGALLLEYFATGIVPPGENIVRQLPEANSRLREHLTPSPTLYLFIVSRSHFELRQIELDPNILQPQAGAQSPTRRLLRPRQLTYLYDRLIAPAAPLLGQHEVLFIVPHGPLHYVPWMALRSSTGDWLLDRDGPAIALAPSATILLRNCLAPKEESEGSFLALGYNDEGDDGLQYAEVEARFVAQLMNGSAWTGPDAKGDRLLTHNEPARWLHVSGHGLYFPHAPLDSALRLGRSDTLSAREIMSRMAWSPSLVTLSACTSGVTQIVSADELLGLPRAFLYAGAPTVICTPWEAPDLVALLVMEQFYMALRRGTPPASALRDAQVALRTMTGQELLHTWERWRATYPEEASLLELPTIASEQLDSAPFADPAHWALFTLVGRPG